MEHSKVAVIGAGITGLVTLKNTLEEGFDVTVFEGRDTIGGVWQYTNGSELSVLETTVSNKSRYKNSYTDFPYPSDAPAFPTAPEVQKYLEAYAQHFDLLPHIRLQTKVLRIVRNKERAKWTVHFQAGNGPETTADFDKVAICTGEWGKPKTPTFAGRDLFKGQLIHTQSFKRPSDFDGKTVAVLGIGNNAADISTALVGHASKIYLAHRGGANLLPRFMSDGKPGDLALNRRLINFKYALNTISPAASEGFFNMVIQSITKKEFKLQPEWRIHPAHSFLCHQPTVSDTLVSSLESGSIISKPSISSFTGAETIEFTDGTTAQVDAVVLCTGFTRDFSLVPEFQTTASDIWSEKANSDGQPLPRLFQNIFPLSHGNSIVFLNNFTFPTGFMWIADLASMAVAQVWKGTSQLPSVEDMNTQIDAHHAWVTKIVERETIASNFVQEKSWLNWCHEAAGTGLSENLGWNWSGWKFWSREMGLSNLIMGGVETPFALRLFEGKRKRWDGAKQAIVDVNEQIKKL